MNKEVEILGYSVISGNLNDIQLFNASSGVVISTINAFSYVLAKTDLEFKNALVNCDMLLPDGFPIAWAANFLKNKQVKKIAGQDIFFHLMHLANIDAKRVFFLGSTQDTLQKIQKKVAKMYPNIKVDSFSPPYKAVFSEEDNKQMIEAVNSFQPDILFVGMTAPKQEKWVEANKEIIHSKLICSIGAVFDFYAETIKRPSKFWINMKLEWFFRFLNEPRRLWKRYFIFSPRFFFDVFMEKFRKQRDYGNKVKYRL